MSTDTAPGHGVELPVREWRNWSGQVRTRPERVAQPRSAAEVAAEVRRAHERGSTVKMVGSGHSFPPIAVTEGTLLTSTGLTGLLAVDRDAMTVTVAAGTMLSDLNPVLERLGLALGNLGDIDEQTVAGAISTGTHGTGGAVASLSAMVVGLELVTGTGEIVSATRDTDPELLRLARLGLGALGILTSVTLQVEPLFLLEVDERPMTWDRVVSDFDELDEQADHLDVYWWPHTERLLVKRAVRLAERDRAQPQSPWGAWRDDELAANTVFGLFQAGAHRLPRATPAINRLSTRLISTRRYSDVSWRVLTARRRVRFQEMEYAVPREAGLAALREARRVLEATGVRTAFPVEVRTAPADDVPLSPAHDRDVLHLAFHTWFRDDHRAYFALVEPVLRAHGGRPHWGKLHTCSAEDLATDYPLMGDFLALRDRLDPDRVFGNAYLRQVLGS